MFELSEELMEAFHSELKTAALGSAATLGAIGALAGGGLQYTKARREGATTGDALRSAGKGALVGGAAGAAGGGALGALRPGAGQAVSNFGQRQLHSVTGWTPKGHATTEDALKHIGVHTTPEAMQMGLTSLPGYAKALGTKGIVPTLYQGSRAALHGTSAVEKGLILGLPAVGLAGAIASPPPEGVSKEENVGQQVGSFVGNLAGAPIPFVGGNILGGAVGSVGKHIGKTVGKLRGVSPQEPPAQFRGYGSFPRNSADLTRETGQAAPSETIMTARASGQPSESFQ